MNVFERTLRRFDRFQQRHTATAFLFGVVKKFGDDNGGTLVTNLAYTAFGSVFVLLLLLVTILGLVLSSHPALEKQVLDSTFGQFPIIGTDLQKNIKALHRNSVISLVISVVGLLWGSLGLAQNGIFTMSQVWNLPGPDRPNYWKRLARSVTFLLVLALGLATSTFLAATIPAVHGGSMLLGRGRRLRFGHRQLRPVPFRFRRAHTGQDPATTTGGRGRCGRRGLDHFAGSGRVRGRPLPEK